MTKSTATMAKPIGSCVTWKPVTKYSAARIATILDIKEIISLSII